MTTDGPFGGLDQIIVTPTKARRPEVGPFAVTATSPDKSVDRDAPSKAGSDAQAQVLGEQAHAASLTQRLEPDPPDSPGLYRKQTLQFGAKELEAVQRLQAAMLSRQHVLTKNDLVRAAVEHMAKDFDLHDNESYLVRKFVRR